MNPRVMIVAPGHPDASQGEPEIAAYHLYRALAEQGGDALFVARAPGSAHGGAPFSARAGGREVLFHTAMRDPFLFTSDDPARLSRDFVGLLQRYRPTVVHFHHYLHLGLEAVRIARDTLPDARIVLTLHDYAALCARGGEMVKEAGVLCDQARPGDCARCLPEHTAESFFLRERYVRAILDDVDVFVAPTELVRERHVAWGIDADRVVVLKSAAAGAAPAPPRPLAPGELRGRFAYFGPIHPHKGLDVLLRALGALDPDLRPAVHLDVHGTASADQAPGYVERVAELGALLGDTVRFRGAHDSSALPTLMAQVDWVVVPSSSWESTPRVIDQAFAHGRPVICSDIGGMAERVRHEQEGLRFLVGSADALAEVITRAARDEDLYQRLVAQLPAPVTAEQSTAEHLDLYTRPLDAGRMDPSPTAPDHSGAAASEGS